MPLHAGIVMRRREPYFQPVEIQRITRSILFHVLARHVQCVSMEEGGYSCRDGLAPTQHDRQGNSERGMDSRPRRQPADEGRFHRLDSCRVGQEVGSGPSRTSSGESCESFPFRFSAIRLGTESQSDPDVARLRIGQSGDGLAALFSFAATAHRPHSWIG